MNLTLPFPPSVNELYRDGGRGKRPKTERYKKWCEEAGWMLKEQKAKAVLGKVILMLNFSPPDKRARGIDNYLKAPLDLLVSVGIIENDEDAVLGLQTLWVREQKPGCYITVRAA